MPKNPSAHVGSRQSSAVDDTEAVITNAEMIGALHQVALGLRPPSGVPGLEDRIVETLQTERGLELLKTWADAFLASIGLVKQFRDELNHSSFRPSNEEISEVASSSQGMLAALFNRLDDQSRRLSA